jgi:hypothetical protein
MDLHVRLFLRGQIFGVSGHKKIKENINKCCAACLNWKSEEFKHEHLWPMGDAEQNVEP